MTTSRIARVLRKRATDALHHDRLAAALTTGRLAVLAAERSGDLRELDAALFVVAVAHSMLGDATGEATCAERRIVLAQRLGDRMLLASALAQRGEARVIAGRYVEGAEDGRRALALLGEREPPAPLTRWAVMSNLGEALLRAGLHDEALTVLDQAYGLAVDGRQDEPAALTASQLGRVSLGLGQPERAVEWAQTAQEHLGRLPDPPRNETAEIQGNLALALSAIGRHDEAATAVDQALRGAEHLPILHRQGLLNAAEVARRAGRHETAIDFTDRWLARAAAGDLAGRAQVLNLRALVRMRQGRLEMAAEHLDESLRLKRATGDGRGVAVALMNLVRVHLDAGRPEQAAAYLPECEALWETLRTRAPDEPGMAGLHDQIAYPLSHAVQELRLAAGDPFGALESAERVRSGPLTALARAAHLRAEELPTDPPGHRRIEELARRLNACLLFYQPHFTFTDSAFGVNPLSTLEHLRELHMWAIASDGRRSHQSVTGAALRDVLSTGPTVPDSRDIPDLGPLLLRPFEGLLRPDQTVIVLPNWLLWSMPFAAFTLADGAQLIDRHPVAYAPSASLLEILASEPASRPPATPLIIGAPTGARLPRPDGGYDEASPLSASATSSIAALYGAEPVLGAACTVPEIRNRLHDADPIHVFAHASLDARPRLDRPPGAIALTPTGDDDGQLTSDMIAAEPVRARLVVLAACHSGLGMITTEGVRGLVRAFFISGAASVVATLRDVPPAPAARITTWLHEERRVTESPAAALRTALLKGRAHYPDPAIWASFVLHGLP
ncbi:hypothetical protein GCM10029978_112750 [Actinoallomurus acanthiterrae]